MARSADRGSHVILSASEISHDLSDKAYTSALFRWDSSLSFRMTENKKIRHIERKRNITPNKGRMQKNHLLKISKWLVECGDDLSYRTVARQVLSARQSLTSVFGMSTGGSSALLPPQWLYNPHFYGIYTVFSIVDD